jgi:Shikimate 5-dehydrogenase
VDRLSDGARLCGAVNLAVKTPDGIVGYNTDVDGVMLSVRETGLPVREALVVGCGGAGRAAAVAALRLGCRVTLVNRTSSKAFELAGELGCEWIPADDIAALAPDLVVYTIPGPMDGFPDFPDAVILEANYRTPCLDGLRKGLCPRPALAAVPGRRRLFDFYGRSAGRRCNEPDFLLTCGQIDIASWHSTKYS